MKTSRPCPICGSKEYKYESYSDDIWGYYHVCEQHGFCDRCGYIIEQAYSPTFEGFSVIKRGIRFPDGRYIPSNARKRRRYKRKYNIKYPNNNWMAQYL